MQRPTAYLSGAKASLTSKRRSNNFVFCSEEASGATTCSKVKEHLFSSEGSSSSKPSGSGKSLSFCTPCMNASLVSADKWLRKRGRDASLSIERGGNSRPSVLNGLVATSGDNMDSIDGSDTLSSSSGSRNT